MKFIAFFVVLFYCGHSFAQHSFSPGSPKVKVEIRYSKRANIGQLGEYLDSSDIVAITKQVGKAVMKEILQKTEVPECITNAKDARLRGFNLYQVAEYVSNEPDDSGFGMQETTYAILQVSANDNRNNSQCKISKTFYIRIVADDIAAVAN